MIGLARSGPWPYWSKSNSSCVTFRLRNKGRWSSSSHYYSNAWQFQNDLRNRVHCANIRPLVHGAGAKLIPSPTSNPCGPNGMSISRIRMTGRSKRSLKPTTLDMVLNLWRPLAWEVLFQMAAEGNQSWCLWFRMTWNLVLNLGSTLLIDCSDWVGCLLLTLKRLFQLIG